MGDSPQPKPARSLFEVPDLELEPVPRSLRTAPTPLEAPRPHQQPPSPLDDDEVFGVGGPRIELGDGAGQQGLVHFGAGQDFDPLGGIELEGNAHPGLAIEHSVQPRAAERSPSAPREGAPPWPSGRVVPRDELAIDPLELSLLANYGEPPKNAYLTPGYAYRVFTRQRELKRALGALEIERARAEGERDHSLAELARAVRPEAEQTQQFSRLFAPLVELEQIASARGQALSSVHAQLTAQASAFDTELAAAGTAVLAEQGREREAQGRYDECEAKAQRAEAKLKRVHIEIRAVTQVAEQKLGPAGGTVPEPEASQLAALRLRADGVEPEVHQAKAELQEARAALVQATGRVTAARQSERLAARKKQALLEHYQKELDVRGRGLSESDEQQHALLSELGRALLDARGAVMVPDIWLERVRSSTERADALRLRCELHARALHAYDRPRAAQGIRLACTGAALLVFLIVLKLAL
jgi:hypothetical protein